MTPGHMWMHDELPCHAWARQSTTPATIKHDRGLRHTHEESTTGPLPCYIFCIFAGGLGSEMFSRSKETHNRKITHPPGGPDQEQHSWNVRRQNVASQKKTRTSLFLPQSHISFGCRGIFVWREREQPQALQPSASAQSIIVVGDLLDIQIWLSPAGRLFKNSIQPIAYSQKKSRQLVCVVNARPPPADSRPSITHPPTSDCCERGYGAPA